MQLEMWAEGPAEFLEGTFRQTRLHEAAARAIQDRARRKIMMQLTFIVALPAWGAGAELIWRHATANKQSIDHLSALLGCNECRQMQFPT